MPYEALESLARSNRWTDLEQQWLSAIEQPDFDEDGLLSVIDLMVKAGQGKLADTLGWAWLSQLKQKRRPAEVLEIGRHLLVHLSDGGELRDEILGLFRQTYADRADLEKWVDRSGLKAGKSVRRALRFIDVGLQLRDGAFLIHRTEDQAAQVISIDLDADEVVIKSGRRSQTLDIASVVDDYNVADENDFRVLQQLHPEKIEDLLKNDPCTLAIGILRAHNNKLNRDAFKLVLVPRFLDAAGWSDWWSRLRAEVKKSANLRIEGRSPMFIIYDPVGRTPEDDMWANFEKSEQPREWLEQVEGYLRDCREQKRAADKSFLDRVQTGLVERINRFRRHKEPALAFATALVLERLAADGLTTAIDAHGMALQALREAKNPAAMVATVTDARLWPLAVAAVEQALPDKWPDVFAELILVCPAGQCDVLAKRIEKAGRGDLLQAIADRALAEPGRYTDALMWIWKGPGVSTELKVPTLPELITLILGLVGPARMSEGKAAGQSVNELRAKVRTGLSARDYERFRACVRDLNDAMGPAIRRLVDRAEGLGPSVQDDMANIVRARFPHMYAKPKVAVWDDDSVLYFTHAGLKAKEDELAEIVNVKMRENAKAIGEAAAHGDLSENSEYKFALEERDLLRARVAKLNRELSIARLLEPQDVPTDHVSIGQRITLAPENGGQSLVITVLGFDESDIGRRVFSYHSPLARQVLGKKPGDPVAVSLDGIAGEYRVDKIERAL